MANDGTSRGLPEGPEALKVCRGQGSSKESIQAVWGGVKGHQAAEERVGSMSGIQDDRWEIQNRAGTTELQERERLELG